MELSSRKAEVPVCVTDGLIAGHEDVRQRFAHAIRPYMELILFLSKIWFESILQYTVGYSFGCSRRLGAYCRPNTIRGGLVTTTGNMPAFMLLPSRS